jgi:hypothetical protein
MAPSVLQPGVRLGLSNTVLHTVPTNSWSLVKRGVFTNIHNAPVTITIEVARASGVTPVLVYNFSLSAYEDYIPPALFELALTAGDVIRARASIADAVWCVLSGYQK